VTAKCGLAVDKKQLSRLAACGTPGAAAVQSGEKGQNGRSKSQRNTRLL
jgi:hypothetical protein